MVFPQSNFKKIKTEKIITVGIPKNYPPLNFTFNNNRIGIEMEMINHLAQYLDVKVNVVPLDVSDYVNAIETGKVDIVIAGMSRSLERSKSIWFSIPYLSLHPAVLVDNRILKKTAFGEDIEEKPVNDLWELKNFNNIAFAIKKGSIYQELFNTKFPENNKKIITTNEEGLELLLNYEVNAFVHDSLYFDYLLRKNPAIEKSFKLLKANDHVEYLSIGLPFGDNILKNQIDIWINEIIRTKKMDEWIKQFNADEN